MEGITEKRSDAVPELLVVHPPPPKKVLPDRSSLGPPPAKPARPSSVNLSELIPPPSSPVEGNNVNIAPLHFIQLHLVHSSHLFHIDSTYSTGLPVSAEVPETETTEVPESNDIVSGAPELPVSELGNGPYIGAETPYGWNLPPVYLSNGISAPVPEVPAVSAPGDEYQDNQLLTG